MKKIVKIVSLLLILTLSVTSFSIDVLALNNSANEISTNDCSTNTYIGNGYKVEFKVSNQWDGAFNGELVITNTGDKPLENWTLKYDFNHEITNMWNAQIISHENNTYTIKNLGWNQDIQPGNSISIGFTANYSDKITSPEKYSMLITNRVLNSNDFSVNFKVTSDWGQAFNGEITITNNTKETIEDWSLEFEFDRNIDSFWTAEILEHTGSHYVIKNAGYNANILAGQSITLGFSGNPGNVDNTPSDYKLIEICEKTDESNNEVIDSDNDGISDAEELKYGTDPNNLDTDGDGLTDYLEVYSFKTNPLVKDTDGDNLNDYDEIRCGTNPLIIDTDGNGVTDDLEDADGDRLTNYEEILFGSSPSNKDSDFDGLDDKSEKELGTDPNNLDSDNDGLFDGKEIEIGTDPLNPDSNGNGILDGDEIFTVSKTPEDKELDKNVTPSINIPLKASQIDTLKIEKVPEDDIFLSSDIPGYIGCGYDFTVDGTFENATLTYEFNYELLSNEDFEPRIYYFNENDQILEELENQVIEGNKVTATITHFSKYILLNKVDFDSVWKNEIKPPSSAGNVDTSVLDVALVIDSSGSMSWNDRDNLRIETSKLFIDKLRENDRACIVDFDDYAYLLSGFKNDKDVLKAALDKIDDNGGTAIYKGIIKALDQFENNGRSAVKNMIVLTDGEDNDSYNYDALLQRAKDNNIIIYTIGLGSDVDTKLLTKIATTTGGKYYNASSAGDLIDEFDKITGETIDFVTDTDKDGISDYYEKAINEGKLRLGTGKSLKGKLNPSKSDTDGDKLKDGKEITITERGTKIYVKYTSDPTKKDTDDDGLFDGEERTVNGKKVLPKDPEPLKINGPEGIWEAQYEQELSGNIPHKLGDSYKLDWSWKDIAASVGAKLLNFKLDDKKIALHSQVETWQKIGGYNDLYDMIFRVGTNGNMAKEKFFFNDDENKEYVLWTWRGDYLNLGSGAEIGIYEKPIDIPLTGSKHWKAADFTLPMTLNLYNYYDKDDIENIFCWAPDEEQWWITGFNPDFGNPKVDDMVSLGTIDFSGHEDMFNSLKENVSQDNKLKDFMIFDEDGHTVWLIWWRK